MSCWLFNLTITRKCRDLNISEGMGFICAWKWKNNTTASISCMCIPIKLLSWDHTTGHFIQWHHYFWAAGKKCTLAAISNLIHRPNVSNDFESVITCITCCWSIFLHQKIVWGWFVCLLFDSRPSDWVIYPYALHLQLCDVFLCTEWNCSEWHIQ